ncbi:type II toxin-antitoxin system HicB family antitoxin [Anabaena sp. FACHB-709]|uniref:HicB-like antitoxin of toxin-antitoxin system domain-containing protein n=2 Tax=Nostocaceae TaxID=1162 RepID=A0A1Z4KMN3_ANAVA|nr:MULTISPECIES: type II toxin-antitoxin system HicB family antitoxin [Nostocaceae]BAY70207.1 hypothetical protein NIES23_30080 [Trichormus variabilis NIES-23]HBW32841.1 type II toxin-antitoxin system HicB family antitoxin [Nostoc sp. UBA8866]MBD2174876.1 type II toxin-antitoxin system HicB family antitoxin [Anabaena cylindrica FACHB-318]MBD2266748.1 type II toxin-antitoxin system HicB family antitoxin [Anabaena sp. FACHB-709]MBD2276300.1 type II toxin-antitoxin system HicB family antitoxin [N
MTAIAPQEKSPRQVLLYLGEDNYFVVEVPSLPGCISQGKTREEALTNIEVLQDKGETLPEYQFINI